MPVTPQPGEVEQKAIRILVLTSSTGTGHDRRAYAFKEWVAQSHDAEVSVRVEHILENSSAITRFGVWVYNVIQLRCPWLHNIYWWVAEGFGILQGAGLNAGGTYYRQCLETFKPTLIFSVHDSTNRGYFETARAVLGPQVKCVTYCGEYSGGFGYSRIWYSAAVDRFYSRNREAEAHAKSLGLQAEKSRIFSNFLPPAFFEHAAIQETPRDIRTKTLGLSPDRFTLFLATGGQGAANHIHLLDALDVMADRLQIIVVCGRNQKLYDATLAWKATHRLTLHIEGYSTRMPELLTASDVVIARGGANLTTEALYMGCPILFEARGGLMPQERLTVNYFCKKGAGKFAMTNRGLIHQLREWLDRPDEFAILRERFRALRQDDHPDQFINELVALARI
ncbi:MAG: glycosyltransferase [Verrucomicrobiota bacterium]|nr:glycosyltransferase [Verrucomicrobiota bacterium]